MPSIIYEITSGRTSFTLQELRDYLSQMAHLDGDVNVRVLDGLLRVSVKATDDSRYNNPVARDAKGRFTKQK